MEKACASLWKPPRSAGWCVTEGCPIYKKRVFPETRGLPQSGYMFAYVGGPSAPLLAKWPAKVAEERLDGNRARRTLTWPLICARYADREVFPDHTWGCAHAHDSATRAISAFHAGVQ